TVRPPPPLFRFLMQSGPIELREAYATFNMGVGFAAYVAPEQAEATLAAAQAAGCDAWVAGQVRRQGTRKAVVVPPLGLTYEAETLKVR
ncbi:MAG TPA: AIR synthase-related protein, partial [Opitutaceae bacterium]|nr:AIR synthase-related protein [Opitutaceae bacterium]